jgi:hypothetical protein
LMCLEWTKNVFLPKFGFKIFRIEKTAIWVNSIVILWFYVIKLFFFLSFFSSGPIILNSEV